MCGLKQRRYFNFDVLLFFIIHVFPSLHLQFLPDTDLLRKLHNLHKIAAEIRLPWVFVTLSSIAKVLVKALLFEVGK